MTGNDPASTLGNGMLGLPPAGAMARTIEHMASLSARRCHRVAGPRVKSCIVIDVAFQVAIDPYDPAVPVHASRGTVNQVSVKTGHH
jgi:hypothetical protein